MLGMAGRRRSQLLVEANRELARVAAALGLEVKTARRGRHLTQKQLATLVGVDRSWISKVERGLGGGASLRVWVALGLAVDRPLSAGLARDRQSAPTDAGHLAIQELLLRLARTVGRTRFVELATRSSDLARSTDVAAIDDRARVVILQEAWNTIGDIGAGLRSSSRKRAEASGLAVLAGGDSGPYMVASCWVVRATEHNRTLVARYPEVFGTAFPGSSTAWVRSLAVGGSPPAEPGLVWCDVGATRLFAWRRGGVELRPGERVGRERRRTD